MRISDWSSDVCSSDLSRTAVLTGKMPSTSGVYNNATDWKTAMPGEITLPHYFKQNGYRTEGAGKIFHHHLNGAFHDSTAFDDFQQMPWPPDAPMPVKKLNDLRSEEHTSELQSLMRISYDVFRLKQNKH